MYAMMYAASKRKEVPPPRYKPRVDGGVPFNIITGFAADPAATRVPSGPKVSTVQLLLCETEARVLYWCWCVWVRGWARFFDRTLCVCCAACVTPLQKSSDVAYASHTRTAAYNIVAGRMEPTVSACAWCWQPFVLSCPAVAAPRLVCTHACLHCVAGLCCTVLSVQVTKPPGTAASPSRSALAPLGSLASLRPPTQSGTLYYTGTVSLR